MVSFDDYHQNNKYEVSHKINPNQNSFMAQQENNTTSNSDISNFTDGNNNINDLISNEHSNSLNPNRNQLINRLRNINHQTIIVRKVYNTEDKNDENTRTSNLFNRNKTKHNVYATTQKIQNTR